MANIVLGMPLQLLLILLRNHFYLWIFQPNRLNFTHLHGICTLSKDKTANVYTDNRYDFRVAHDFAMLWKQHSFLTSSGNNI